MKNASTISRGRGKSVAFILARSLGILGDGKNSRRSDRRSDRRLEKKKRKPQDKGLSTAGSDRRFEKKKA